MRSLILLLLLAPAPAWAGAASLADNSVVGLSSSGATVSVTGGKLDVNATVNANSLQDINIISTFSAMNPGYVNAQGLYSTGTVASPKPVIVGGLTSSGTVKNILLDSNGALQVSVVPAVDTGNKYYMVDTSINRAATGDANLGTDNPMLLIVNPSTSTKTLGIVTRIYGIAVTNVMAMFRLYDSPVVTSSGTALSVRPGLSGNSTPSVAQAYKLPTVSSKGDLLDSYIISQNSSGAPIQESQVLQLPPGKKWLVTAAPSSNNREVDISVKWIEQ